jgi:NAD(P)-dependent dehydrogenase (short-subunit alcohol dehydrogenase family)
MVKLKNKIAIVTGASRGLGKAVALGLAGEGASVVVTARTETEENKTVGTIHKTAEEIGSLGVPALAVKCDVTREDEVAAMIDKTLEWFGRIDILVNNAGIASPSSILDMTLKRWELVLRVNLTGTFLCSKAVVPSMMNQRSGSIINISSVQAQGKGSAETGIAYGVSKAAIERLTIGFAMEVSKYNIAVNCVKPRGSVVTEGMKLLNPNHDWSAWDTPHMFVKAVTFLACQDALGVAGTISTDEQICMYHGLL